METLSFTDTALLVLTLWLLVLTFLHIFAKRGRSKISGGKNQNLDQTVSNLLNNQEQTNKNIARVIQEIEKQRTLTKSSFQKSALVRFNPFEDTGGDQSFIVALLNGGNSGIVISSLHSRNGTRVYAKQIISGKAQDHELSKEEKETVEKAIKG